ncbi:MAG: hypothetical protein P8X55_14345, partial [Desulfosarcinaceae bacterium]
LAYHFKKMPGEELRAYALAIRANPKFVPAHFNMGLFYVKEGNRNLALQEYTILKSLDEDTANALFNHIYPQGLEEMKRSGAGE